MRKNNIYKIRLSDLKNQNVKFLMSVNEKQWKWYRRLGHVSTRSISQLNKLNLVRVLLNLKFASDALSEACQKGKFSKLLSRLKVLFQPLDHWSFFILTCLVW